MKDDRRLVQLMEEIALILRKDFNPHTTVVITESHGKIVSDEKGYPLGEEN